MKTFNSFLQKSMPFLPKSLIGMVAKKYIAGATLNEALNKVQKLNSEGYYVTMDVLGESAVKLEDTVSPVTQYLNVLDTIHNHKLQGNISLKLSQLGLSLDKNHCKKQFLRIFKKAKELNIFLRIDMEDSPLTDATLDIYRMAREDNPKGVGIVFQSYLHRSEDDIKKLMEIGTDIRICKGIYKESPKIAFQDRTEIRENTIKLIKLLMDGGQYVAIASHDLEIIKAIRLYIEEKNISKDKFEFQSLLGVPIDKTLNELLAKGYKVRYYVPFGTEWYAYASRRVLENPDIAGYIVKDFFTFWKR